MFRAGSMALALALGIVSSVHAQPVAPSQHSAQSFGRLPFISGPSMSPDGTRILARVAAGKKQVLGIVSLDEAGAAPIFINLGQNDLIDWGWVNKDWLYVRLGDEGIIEDFPLYITRVVAISADGKTIRPIALRKGGQHSEVIWVAHDGSARVLISAQQSIFDGEGFWPSVSEYDFSTGRSKPVVDSVSGIGDWYADASGAVRIGIGFNRLTGSQRVIYRPDGKGLFTTVARKEAGSDGVLLVPKIFMPDGKTAVAFSNHEGFDWLYDVDLQTFGIGKKVFGAAGYDLDSTYANAKGDGIDGVTVTANRTRNIWSNPVLAGAQAALEKSLGKDQQPTIISFSDDRKKMIVAVGGPDQAGTLQIFSADTGALRLLAYQNEDLKQERLGTVSTIRYRARDNIEIAAVLTVPRGKPAKSLPLIVMPHGGPYGIRDSEGYDWWVQFMVSRGYAVVQPNYRGSGGYGRAFEKLGDGQWGSTMQDDLLDVIDHLATAGIADPKRVCIVGGSYGGYAAMRAAQRDGSRYRCAVSYAGVSDLVGMKRYDQAFLYGKLSSKYWRDVAPDIKAVSPINYPQQFSTPILIVHGAKDKRVPIAQSEGMADRLKSAGKVYKYVKQPEGDHHFTREEDRVQFLEELDTFLKQYNPA